MKYKIEKVIVLYLRVSDEDNHEFQNESNSIISQREILTEYIRNCEEFLEYSVVEICDDGFSGTSFARPGIQKLFAKVKKGEVSCIIVKDFSRFGRNYIEVGSYLEQVFPFFGIRFISVNDCFDSKVSDFKGDFFDITFKNLVYDLYSKDLSEKVTSIRRRKAEQGKFFTAYAPYGYLKSSDQKLIPDYEAAQIVQRIFSMAIDGVPKAHIAKVLNSEGIPTPFMLRKLRGQHFPCRTVNKKSVWRTATIASILKDQRYTGDAVYGKVKPKTVGSGKNCIVPKEQWIIVSNVNEAIISRKEFEMVNSMFQRRTHYQRTKDVPLAGVVYCAGCKHLISRVKRERPKGRQTVTYRCSIQDTTKEFGCYAKAIEESKIENVVLQLLQKIVSVILDSEIMNKVQDLGKERSAELKGNLVRDRKELDKLTRIRRTKYELYKDTLISKEEFIKERIILNKKIKEVQLDIQGQQYILDNLECFDITDSNPFDLIKQFVPLETLTKEIVNSFVKQIVIGKDGSLQIEWKFHKIF